MAYVTNDLDPRDVIKGMMIILKRKISPEIMKYIDSINRRSTRDLKSDIKPKKPRKPPTHRIPYDASPHTRHMLFHHGRPITRQRRTTRWTSLTLGLFESKFAFDSDIT